MILIEAYVVFAGAVALAAGYLMVVNHFLGEEEESPRPALKRKPSSYATGHAAMSLTRAN
jgi:hypothetical protein